MLNGTSFGATFREGVFEVNLPSSFSRVSKPKLDELRKTMMGARRNIHPLRNPASEER